MKNNSIKTNNVVVITLLIILIVVVVCLGGYIIYDKDKEPQLLTNTQATEIVQGIYKSAYYKIVEGSKLINQNTEYSKISGTHTNLVCYKMDFSTITNLFTSKGLDYIKAKFTDSVEGDSDYYKCNSSDNNLFYTNTVNFMNTIFGVTDQGERELIVSAVTSDTIIATGKLNTADKYPLYIIFKKVNNNWIIDYFE